MKHLANDLFDPCDAPGPLLVTWCVCVCVCVSAVFSPLCPISVTSPRFPLPRHSSRSWVSMREEEAPARSPP